MKIYTYKQSTPNKNYANLMKIMPTYILIKELKIKEKQKLSKAARGKKTHYAEKQRQKGR